MSGPRCTLAASRRRSRCGKGGAAAHRPSGRLALLNRCPAARDRNRWICARAAACRLFLRARRHNLFLAKLFFMYFYCRQIELVVKVSVRVSGRGTVAVGPGLQSGRRTRRVTRGPSGTRKALSRSQTASESVHLAHTRKALRRTQPSGATVRQAAQGGLRNPGDEPV